MDSRTQHDLLQAALLASDQSRSQQRKFEGWAEQQVPALVYGHEPLPAALLSGVGSALPFGIVSETLWSDRQLSKAELFSKFLAEGGSVDLTRCYTVWLSLCHCVDRASYSFVQWALGDAKLDAVLADLNCVQETCALVTEDCYLGSSPVATGGELPNRAMEELTRFASLVKALAKEPPATGEIKAVDLMLRMNRVKLLRKYICPEALKRLGAP